MSTVKILINDIKASISDEVLSQKLKDRLYDGGFLTQEPSSVERDHGDLVVTLGVYGTIDLPEMAGCVDRYLKDKDKPELIYYSDSDVVLR